MQRDARDAKPKTARLRGADPTQPARRSKGQIPALERLADMASIDARTTKPAKAHGTRAESRAVVKIEAASADGRTSRKSTRASANRIKQDTQLTSRTQRALRSPETRAAKAVAARATRAGAKKI